MRDVPRPNNPDDLVLIEDLRDGMLGLGWKYPQFLPMFAAIRIVVTEHPAVNTFATDYLGNVYVNPKFAATVKNKKQRTGIMCHEVMHPHLLHDRRKDGRDDERWGMAADRAINQLLKRCGIELPSHALYPDAGQEDWNTEQLYENEPEQPKLTISVVTGKGPPKPVTGGCGMIDPLPGAPGADDPRITTTKDSKGNVHVEIDKTLLEELEQKWQQVAAQTRSLGRGDEIGGLFARILDAPEPKVAWRDLLLTGFGEIAAGAMRDDVTYSKRSRRSGLTGPILPGWVSQQVFAAVVVDTSGSMSDEDITQACAEAAEIAKSTGTRLYLVVHDADVQWAGWVEDDFEGISSKMKGRGGTTFAPAYRAVAAVEEVNFSLMVHLTDGFGEGWPPQPANVQRVIIGLLGYGREAAVPAEFESVEVRLD